MFSFCLDFLSGFQSCCFEVNCRPPLIELPLMLHRFSRGLRSGDDGGHTMNFFSLHAHSSQGPNGIFAAWNGALSCMKMILLLKARFFFLYHGSKWAVRNSTYFAEVIWTPWGTLKGLIKSLPMFPAQNITLPSPC